MHTSLSHIGFDAKRAMLNHTGLGNYSRYAISAMVSAYPSIEFSLYSPSSSAGVPPVGTGKMPVLLGPQGAWAKAGILWRTFGIVKDLKRDGIELYHGLSNELPLNIRRSGVRSVVTIHDVIWRRVPEDYNPIDRKLYDWKYGASARNADRVIAISECTKRDLVNDFGIDPCKIDVIFQGCNPIFRQPLDAAVAQQIKVKYDLPDTFMACVGTIQKRKNQLLAVKGMQFVPKEVKLVIVGRRSGPYNQEITEYIARNGLADRVIWLEGVPFADLPYIYGMAACSSYTSRYEGFGLPIIESLSCGTPVIGATGSCLEEAGGEGAVYVDPDDAELWGEVANRIISDSEHRSELAARGAQHIAKFNAEEFARSTMETYTKCLG